MSTIVNATWRPFETTEEQRQRLSVERYEKYQNDRSLLRGLNGYEEKLGDIAPAGTWRPGYTSPEGYGYNNSRSRR